MSEAKSPARNYWGPRMEKGKRYFTWRYGVVGWGMPTSVIWSAAMEIWRSGSAEFSIVGFLLYLLISLPLFMIGGYVWARFMWWATTRKASAY